MPLPDAPLRPIRRLAREDVYDQLSRWIIEGVLQPAEPLRDQDIAERMGVSRTPVREALRRLEDEGLVETALNRWTRISPLDPARAAELYPVIEVLETLALHLALPHLGPEAFETLGAINGRLGQALLAGDARSAVQADTDFHAVWITRADNTELQGTLHTLKRKLQRIELAYFDHQASAQASIHEHAALVEALQAGQMAAAESALRQNWQGSLQRLGVQMRS
ncbi:GntR family transcriptional regulator [Deinococcus marmoris]|uniref:GntR family transcriptional regulator n=1 Tax=Deinococcus marmoris TaxID=249408 RepID=UPI00049594B0|nr:GntR family transcriptional regulator [Deinococcus marmoris]